jgi:hypothetical protein
MPKLFPNRLSLILTNLILDFSASSSMVSRSATDVHSKWNRGGSYPGLKIRVLLYTVCTFIHIHIYSLSSTGCNVSVQVSM